MSKKVLMTKVEKFWEECGNILTVGGNWERVVRNGTLLGKLGWQV